MFARGGRRTLTAMLTRSQFATIRENLKIEHHPKDGMFYADIDGKRAFVQYEKNKDLITLQETLVPAELEGRGLGKILAKEVFEYIAKNNLKTKIECTFLQHYVKKYAPEYEKLIANN